MTYIEIKEKISQLSLTKAREFYAMMLKDNSPATKEKLIHYYNKL